MRKVFLTVKPSLAVVLVVSLFGCAGVSMSPSHEGHYTFSGSVVDTSQKPIQGARVKVLGWETTTDQSGKWRQDQIVECGASRETMNAHTKKEAVLVTADGYSPTDHSFDIERGAWFAGCPKDRAEYSFQTVLQAKKEGGAAVEAYDPGPSKEHSTVNESPSRGVAL